MNALLDVNMDIGTTVLGTDGAVGVCSVERVWYVAIVKNKSELKCAKRLKDLGYECYVPTQEETCEEKSGARRMVERIIFPAKVFVYAMENERRQTIVNLPYINRFMTDRASSTDTYNRHRVAVIPDDQMKRLKFMLSNAESRVEIEPMYIRLGDKVRVVRGGLRGISGNVIKCAEKGSAYFAIRVDFLGVAKVRVRLENLEKI